MNKNNKLKKWWNALWKTRKKLLVIFFLVIASIIANYYSGWYVDNTQTVPANDLILDNISPTNVSFIFIGYFLFVLALLYLLPLFLFPEKFYYYTGMFSLLAIFRSGFIVLTHLQGAPTALTLNYPEILYKLGLFIFSNDLFFSGHTALPFLGFLIFKNRYLKVFFLISSFILAASALLMHRHYSIDVFAAFFITYGVYKIGNNLFQSNFFRKI